MNFLIVGMAEEGVKYVVLKTQTWKHKAFDYRFDGIVYAAVLILAFMPRMIASSSVSAPSAALGFAIAE